MTGPTLPGGVTPGGSDERIVADAVERMRQLSTELDRQANAYRQELVDLRREFARQDEERAAAARRGELGDRWQRLQRRIDLNETSIGAFITGDDDSVDAQELRSVATERLDRLYDEQIVEVEDDEVDPVVAETVALQGEIRETVERIARKAQSRPA